MKSQKDYNNTFNPSVSYLKVNLYRFDVVSIIQWVISTFRVMCPSVNISSCGSTTTSYTTLHTPIWSLLTIYMSPHQWTVVHTALASSPQRNRAYPTCQIFCSYSWSRNSNHWAPYRISPTPPGQRRSPIDPPGPKNMQTCTQTPSRATSSLSTAGWWRQSCCKIGCCQKLQRYWYHSKDELLVS